MSHYNLTITLGATQPAYRPNLVESQNVTNILCCICLCRTIEAALYAHATRGAGYGNTLYSENTPVKDKTEYHLPKIRVKPIDDFTNEGVDFLTSLRNGMI